MITYLNNSGWLYKLLLTTVFLVVGSLAEGANTAVDQTRKVALETDSTQIRQLLEERDREIKELMGPKGKEYTQEQRDQLKDIINNVIDYRTMARQALQTTFDTLSEQKREQFVDLFSRVVRDQSLNKLDIYRADVKYQRISVSGDSAYVETMARLEDTRTPVYYRMNEQQQGWMITDMIIDEVSTVASYRRSFQNIINKKGFETLMETLRKRVKD